MSGGRVIYQLMLSKLGEVLTLRIISLAETPRLNVLKRLRCDRKWNVSHCGLVSGLILFRDMMSSIVFSTFSGWMLRADCSSYKWQEQTCSSIGGEVWGGGGEEGEDHYILAHFKALTSFLENRREDSVFVWYKRENRKREAVFVNFV